MSRKLRSYLLFTGVVLLFTAIFGINAYAADYSESRRSDFQLIEKTIIIEDSESAAKTKKHTDLYQNDIIAPTCTQNGYKGGIICLDCYAVIEAPKIIPPKGHTPKTEYKFIQNGTNFVRTSYTVCADCGVQLTVPILIKHNTECITDKSPDTDIYSKIKYPMPGYDCPEIRPSSSIIDFIVNLFRKLFR